MSDAGEDAAEIALLEASIETKSVHIRILEGAHANLLGKLEATTQVLNRTHQNLIDERQALHEAGKRLAALKKYDFPVVRETFSNEEKKVVIIELPEADYMEPWQHEAVCRLASESLLERNAQDDMLNDQGLEDLDESFYSDDGYTAYEWETTIKYQNTEAVISWIAQELDFEGMPGIYTELMINMKGLPGEYINFAWMSIKDEHVLTDEGIDEIRKWFQRVHGFDWAKEWWKKIKFRSKEARVEWLKAKLVAITGQWKKWMLDSEDRS